MICNKCGRPISSRLSRPVPLCMRCRYQAMRQGAPSVAAKIKPKSEGKAATCVECGKELPPFSGNRRKYCDACREHRKRFTVKRCAKCGAEFETRSSNSLLRDLCFQCAPKRQNGMRPRRQKPKALTPEQKVEKMRAIRETGMTYGQYMAAVENGLPVAAATESDNEPPKKEEAATGWIPVGRREEEFQTPAPKVRLKIPISRLPCRGEPTRSITGPRRQCAAWNL